MMNIIKLLLLVAILPIINSYIILQNNTKLDINCFNNIVAKLNVTETLVTVLEGDLDGLSIEPARIILNPKLKNRDHSLTKSSAYLVLLNHTKFSEVILFLSACSTWNPKSKFIVFAPYEDKMKILETAYQYYVYNIIVLVNEENNFNIYNWGAVKKCGQPQQITRLDSCKNGILTNNSTLFQLNTDLKNTWTNCQLRILPLIIPPYIYEDAGILKGVEIRILEMIQEKMKFKIKVINHQFDTWGKKNDTKYSHMFGIIQINEADLLLGLWSMNFTHYWDFDPCFPLINSRYTWIVPTAIELTHWVKLLKIYPVIIWICFVALVFVFPVLWKLADKLLLNMETDAYRNWIQGLLYSISVTLGIGVPHQPRTPTIRMVFITWVIFCLLISSVYQSKLVATLTKPQYKPQLMQVSDVVATSLALGINSHQKAMFNKPEKPRTLLIYYRSISCDETEPCMNRTAFKKDMALIANANDGIWNNIKYYTNPDGTSLIHIMESTIYVTCSSMVFAKGHPMFDDYNRYGTIISESGFVKYWIDDVTWKLLLSHRLGKAVMENSMALNLKQMLVAFLLLAIGLMCATIVFIFEYLVQLIIRNCNRRPLDKSCFNN